MVTEVRFLRFTCRAIVLRRIRVAIAKGIAIQEVMLDHSRTPISANLDSYVSALVGEESSVDSMTNFKATMFPGAQLAITEMEAMVIAVGAKGQAIVTVPSLRCRVTSPQANVWSVTVR